MQRSERHAQKKGTANWRKYGRWGFAATVFCATVLVCAKLTIFISQILAQPLPITHGTNYQGSQHIWTIAVVLVWLVIVAALVFAAIYDKGE